MEVISEVARRIDLRKILYLTDFSGPSERALPFVFSLARKYEAGVYALHVMLPASPIYSTPESGDAAVKAEEEFAQSEMQKVDAQLVGVAHETSVEWGEEIWPVVERKVVEEQADLIVVGTHGRTGHRSCC